jgi:Phosphopantetheine attachment site
VGDLVEVLTPELASVPTVSSGHSGRARPVERALSSALLAEVLGRESVPVEAHFLDDLGADSMTMAQFCAPVRTRGDLPPVSITDLTSLEDVLRRPVLADLVDTRSATVVEQPGAAPPAPPAAELPPGPPARTGRTPE